jgi:hypothetical protein
VTVALSFLGNEVVFVPYISAGDPNAALNLEELLLRGEVQHHCFSYTSASQFSGSYALTHIGNGIYRYCGANPPSNFVLQSSGDDLIEIVASLHRCGDVPLWFVTIAFVSRATRSRCLLPVLPATGLPALPCDDATLASQDRGFTGCCLGHVTQVAVACLRTNGLFSEKVSCVDGEPASLHIPLDVQDNSQLSVSRNLEVFNSVTTSGNDNFPGNNFPLPGIIQLIRRTNFPAVESANAPCDCIVRQVFNPPVPGFFPGYNNFNEEVFKHLTDTVSFSLTAT